MAKNRLRRPLGNPHMDYTYHRGIFSPTLTEQQMREREITVSSCAVLQDWQNKRIKRDAEEKAKRDAEENANQETKERAQAAEEQAQQGVVEPVQRETEAQAQREAEERAQNRPEVYPERRAELQEDGEESDPDTLFVSQTKRTKKSFRMADDVVGGRTTNLLPVAAKDQTLKSSLSKDVIAYREIKSTLELTKSLPLKPSSSKKDVDSLEQKFPDRFRPRTDNDRRKVTLNCPGVVRDESLSWETHNDVRNSLVEIAQDALELDILDRATNARRNLSAELDNRPRVQLGPVEGGSMRAEAFPKRVREQSKSREKLEHLRAPSPQQQPLRSSVSIERMTVDDGKGDPMSKSTRNVSDGSHNRKSGPFHNESDEDSDRDGVLRELHIPNYARIASKSHSKPKRMSFALKPGGKGPDHDHDDAGPAERFDEPAPAPARVPSSEYPTSKHPPVVIIISDDEPEDEGAVSSSEDRPPSG